MMAYEAEEEVYEYDDPLEFEIERLKDEAGSLMSHSCQLSHCLLRSSIHSYRVMLWHFIGQSCLRFSVRVLKKSSMHLKTFSCHFLPQHTDYMQDPYSDIYQFGYLNCSC